jgi:hypothetical protein
MISRESASAEAEHRMEKEVEVEDIGLRLAVKHWDAITRHTSSEVELKLPSCPARVLYGMNCRQDQHSRQGCESSHRLMQDLLPRYHGFPPSTTGTCTAGGSRGLGVSDCQAMCHGRGPAQALY